jgi:ribonuclease P protein component
MFLRCSRDIERVKRHGRRISTALFNLLAYECDEPSSRVGIIVGKRFGTAVRRNRAKRVFRELVRSLHDDLPSGLSLLVFPKREALVHPFADLKKFWQSALERAHLLHPKAQ